jgi:hypothetical protein
MLKNEIKKKSIKKHKKPKSGQVRPLNSWYELWDHDNLIESKQKKQLELSCQTRNLDCKTEITTYKSYQNKLWTTILNHLIVKE